MGELDIPMFPCTCMCICSYTYTHFLNISVYEGNSFNDMYSPYDFVHSAMLDTGGYFQGHILGRGYLLITVLQEELILLNITEKQEKT